MLKDKNVLLIAGGGTLGTYTAEDLLARGANVDVICLEDKVSNNACLNFIKDYFSFELAERLFKSKHYDAIVNFIHYSNVEEFKKTYDFLIKNTNHLIFLSSYRVYANVQHPITESAPRVHEVFTYKTFLDGDGYGVRKARCEDFLFNERKGERWTIVRPVISFSQTRLDIVMNSGEEVLGVAKSGKPLYLPESVKDFTAGLDWAGNSGKLISRLILNEKAIGEAFTISSGQNLTWGEVANEYQDKMGIKVEWVSDKEYLDKNPQILSTDWRSFAWYYDRKFSRDIDNSKVLSVTNLSKSDFLSIGEGIKIELEKLGFTKN